MSQRMFDNSLRLWASKKSYADQFGTMPGWIDDLDKGEASVLLDLASTLRLRLQPGHLAWWLSRRRVAGESPRRVATMHPPIALLPTACDQ